MLARLLDCVLASCFVLLDPQSNSLLHLLVVMLPENFILVRSRILEREGPVEAEEYTILQY